MSISLEQVVGAIADLDVSGVNVRDIDNIPTNAKTILPVLYPLPNGFITELTWTRESFGSDAVAAMNISYVLHYRYLHAVVGSGGGLLSVYAGMINNIVKILAALFADSNPSGAVDMTLVTISDIGALPDPSGELQYHGVDITIRVLEYIQ